jgi:glycosyltransferase involved in cell wall biosynthesis
MRICFLCNEYPPGPHGGLGTLARLLGRAIVRAGHEIRVAGVYPAEFEGPPYEVDEGVRVWRLRGGSSRPAKALARRRLYRMVRAWIRERKIDLVEAPDWEGWVAGWPRLNVPVVARLNGSVAYFAAETGERAPRLTAAFERASLQRTDAWCAASRYVAERTRAVFGLRLWPMAILHNPVELPPASDSTRIPGRVVFSGRLIAKKGLEPLLRAWPRVRAQVPGAELHLFGRDGPVGRAGSMRAFLQGLIGDVADPGVVFHGHVDREELARALDTASVAVFPSYAEAFAFAPMEAMASGCATVYSLRGSGPELITDGMDGLLVEPSDPGKIAGAVIRLLTDADLRLRLGSAGRRRIAESFSMPVLLPANEAFYRDVIERFRRAERRQRQA